jgi:outer membrane lipoprotein-sorting protein
MRVVKKFIVGVFCLAACLFAAVPASSEEIPDGAALLTAMHDRYKDSWYESVVFKENAITLNPDGTTKTEVWDEALQLPGKLRINRGASSEGNGFVFVDGTLTSFQKGKATGPRPFVHMLLVLGFDVYRQDPKTTIDQAKGQGFDLTQIHEEKWDGQDVYVVGAAKGDLNSKQFWIEKKRLLFVRLIAPDEHDATKIHDTRFRDYRKLSTGWISARVEFYVDGKNTFNEDYFAIKANAKFDPALFERAKFNETSISNDAKP